MPFGNSCKRIMTTYSEIKHDHNRFTRNRHSNRCRARPVGGLLAANGANRLPGRERVPLRRAEEMTRMPYDPLPCGCIPGVFACEEHKFLRRLESEMRDGYL